MFCKFHPSASHTLATADLRNDIKVWDIEKGEDIFCISHEKKYYSLEWNYDGSLLGVVGDDRRLGVIDPRSHSHDGVIMQGMAHDTGKATKLSFLNSQRLLTMGYNKNNNREYAIFDIRKLGEDSLPLVRQKLDQNVAVPYLKYDYTTGMVFVWGKGDKIIKYFEVMNEDPYLFHCDTFSSTSTHLGCAFAPKRTILPANNEIIKVAKISDKHIEYINFKLPSKVSLYIYIYVYIYNVYVNNIKYHSQNLLKRFILQFHLKLQLLPLRNGVKEKISLQIQRPFHSKV